MPPNPATNPAISSSKNVLLIHLDSVRLEDIVEERLDCFLKEKELFHPQLLKQFYEPVERACIEFNLIKLRGNQLKTAQLLGINRNTLKKKIGIYRLDIKDILLKSEEMKCFENRIFVSPAGSFDLLSLCRTKIALDDFKALSPKENVLKSVCYPVEQRIIQKTLKHYKGNQIRSSIALGINRNTLKKKVNLNGLGVAG